MEKKPLSDAGLMRSLLELSHRLEKQSCVYGLLDDIAKTFSEIFGFNSAWLFIATEDKGQYQLLSMRDENREAVPNEVQCLNVNGDKMLEEIVATNRIVYVENAETDPRTNKELVKLMKNRTIVNIPISILSRHLGILGTGSFADEGTVKLNSSHIDFLEAIAKYIAVAIDRIQLVKGTTIMAREKARLRHELFNAKKLESMGTLAGGISHDFNNLLYIISMAIEMAKNTPDNVAKRNDFLEQALTAGHRGKALVSQILKFSQQDDEAESMSVTDVVPIIDETISFLRATFPSQIVISYNCTEKDINCKLATTHISQIILNLTLNAKYAMKEHGGKLDITLEIPELQKQFKTTHQLKATDYCRLSIKDTGTGIPQKDLEQIFDPFFTTKPLGDGTGLGLSVVRELVTDHGGLLLAENNSDKGCCFSMYLPIYDALDEKIKKTDTPISTLPISTKFGKERILLIEDDLDVGELEKMMLESMKYTVTYCSSSTEGVELFAKHPNDFDLVITDYTMPNIKGTEVAQKIMQTRADIPIILLTGFSDVVDEEHALELGIVAYLMKPITALELSDTLRKIFSSKVKLAS